jgi:hypothetical protein
MQKRIPSEIHYTITSMTKTYLLNHSPAKTKTKYNADLQHQKTKWVTFTYNGKEEKLQKFFRTQIKAAFRTRNTIQNILKPWPQTDKYSRSGIYQMKCPDSPLRYIGQTRTSFNT